MMPEWHQLVPLSGHVEDSETEKKTKQNKAKQKQNKTKKQNKNKTKQNKQTNKKTMRNFQVKFNVYYKVPLCYIITYTTGS